MNFSEKTAVVTGGSRGLGRAICLELARGGANVMLCYAGNEAAANETVAACESLGAKAVAVRCDVSKEDEVKALMDAALKTFGRIDILVNNAGITRDGLLMMMKPEDFDAVIAANLRGAFLCMKAVARQMVKQRYGRIVNLSSVVGLRGNAGQVNYAASKAGRHRHDQIPCQGTGGTEHHRQRRGPRLYRHGYDRRPDGDREKRRPRLHSHGPHGHAGKRGQGRGLFSRRGRRLHHRAGFGR